MRKIIAIVIFVATTVFGASGASAQNGGYWVSMGAPGGPQIRYNNGVYYGQQRSAHPGRPAWNGPHGPGMRHPRGGIVPPRAILPQTFYQHRGVHRGMVAPVGGALVGGGLVSAGHAAKPNFEADRAARQAENAARKAQFVAGCNAHGAPIAQTGGGHAECHSSGSVEEYVDGKLVNRY